MELIVLLVLVAVIGLALWWPRSDSERAERERALSEWRQMHDRSNTNAPKGDPPP